MKNAKKIYGNLPYNAIKENFYGPLYGIKASINYDLIKNSLEIEEISLLDCYFQLFFWISLAK